MSSNRFNCLLTIPAFCFALLPFFSAPVLAQNEMEQVGFQANHAYEAGQFGEGIDVLGGTLNFTVPVGPRYQVNSNLGYQLTLAYSSRVWDATNMGFPGLAADQHVLPTAEGPTGIGFNMHLGRIVVDTRFVDYCLIEEYESCWSNTYTWIAPDGSRHDFFQEDYKREPDYFPQGVDRTDRNHPVFYQRKTTDLSNVLISGPNPEFCFPAAASPGCYRVETPDGLVYSLAPRVACADPANPDPIDTTAQTLAYAKNRAQRLNYCGWYTTLIEDPSVGQRTVDATTHLITSPFPNFVKVTYDGRPGFQHLLYAIEDSTGRAIGFQNCEWEEGKNFASWYSEVPGGDIVNKCTTTPSAAPNRDKVATYAIDFPAFAASESLVDANLCPTPCPDTIVQCDDGITRSCKNTCDRTTGICSTCTPPPCPPPDGCHPGAKICGDSAPSPLSTSLVSTTATLQPPVTPNRMRYFLYYELSKVQTTDKDFEDWCCHNASYDTVCNTDPVLTCRVLHGPVLKLVRMDYPETQRVDGAGTGRQSLYFGSNGYGEIDCRTLPIPTMVGNACGSAGVGAAATFEYDYDYFTYISTRLSQGRAPKKGTNCDTGTFWNSLLARWMPGTVCTGLGGGGAGPGLLPAGTTHAVVGKRIEIPSGTVAGRWTYDRGAPTARTNPEKVIVTDPFGNDTVYIFHASIAPYSSGTDGTAPQDGAAPEWNDGMLRRTEWYEGRAGSGRLVRAQTNDYEADFDWKFQTQFAKKEIRARSTQTIYADDGARVASVSRSAWDGYGHWGSEAATGFTADESRITYRAYSMFDGSIYRGDRLLREEVSDGHHLLSRAENQYDARGRLLNSIQRQYPPAAPGTPVPSPDLAASRRPGDVLATYSYSDASGNVIGKTLSTGRAGDPTYTIRYGYTPAGGTCTVAGECGGYLKTKTFLSGATGPFKSIDRDRDGNTGWIFTTRDTAGVSTGYRYDDLGRVTEILPDGEDPTRIDYVSLLETTVTRGTRGGSDLDTQADFVFSRYVYDKLGRLAAVQERPADPDGTAFSCQQTQYDIADRVLYSTTPAFQPRPSCNGLPGPRGPGAPGTTFSACATETTIDADSMPGTAFDYRDPDSRLCDPFGRVRRETPPGPGRDATAIDSKYRGPSTWITINGVRGAEAKSFPATTAYIRDGLGRLIAVDASTGGRCSASGGICSGPADCAADDACIPADGGADAYYSYDALDRLVRADLSDNLSQSQPRRFAYDGLGHLLWEEQPESGTTVYLAYDALGNLLSSQDVRGNGRTWSFDFAGRLSEETVRSAVATSSKRTSLRQYDAAGHGTYALGKLTTLQSYDDDGNLVLTDQRVYDGRGGRVSSVSWSFPDWLAGSTATMTMAYDARGQLETLAYPKESTSTRDRLTVQYGYGNGSAKKVSLIDGTLLGRVAYNAAGSVASVDTPGGGRTAIDFDEHGRPKRITAGVWSGGAWAAAPKFDAGPYAYDGAGNIYRIGDPATDPEAREYGYDAASRLIAARTRHEGTQWDESFAYDVFGNLLRHDLTTFAGGAFTESDSFAIAAPATNRIASRQTVSGGDATASPMPFRYDASGNLVEGGRRWRPGGTGAITSDIERFEYGALNRLRRVERSGDPATGGDMREVGRFVYDASGNRVTKTERRSGPTTYYLRDDDGRTLSEFRNLWNPPIDPEWAADYVYLAGRMLGLRENLRPGPPSGLTASQAPTTGGWLFSLAWNQAEEPDKANYRIYTLVGSQGTTFSLLGESTAASFSDPNVYSGTTMVRYHVRTVDATGYESLPSSEIAVIPGDRTGPAAPGLSALSGDGMVVLSWTSSSDSSGIAGYEVFRRESLDVPSMQVTSQLITGTTYVDLNVTNGGNYYYRVRARDNDGNAGPLSCRVRGGSICDVNGAPRDLTPPAPPKDLTATTFCGADNRKVQLSWSPTQLPPGVVVTYEIYRNTLPAFDGLAPIANIAGTSYLDEPPAASGPFVYYGVKALRNSFPVLRSALSQVLGVTRRDSTQTPQLYLSAKSTDATVRLSWRLKSGFTFPRTPVRLVIHRKLNAYEACNKYAPIATLDYSSAGQFTDAGLANNAAYDYAITAIDDMGVESEFSAPAIGIPLARPTGLFQCARNDPWRAPGDSPLYSTMVQWEHPAASFYQPFLATTTDGTLGFLKGYHLYHHKVCSGFQTGNCCTQGGDCWSCFVLDDNSPLRVVVNDPSDPVDPYLIRPFERDFHFTYYPYEDPRGIINSESILSPPFQRDGANLDLFVSCYSGNQNVNCAVPRAVYKIYADGTWLTVESDWPDFFNPLQAEPQNRCAIPLQNPYGALPACDDGAIDNPSYVPPPRKVTVQAMGNSFHLNWVPPSIAPGKPVIAGYYLYGRQARGSQQPSNSSVHGPLPFAVVGPHETSTVLEGVPYDQYEFTVSTLDDSGRVSGMGTQQCMYSGSPWTWGCLSYCTNTHKICSTTADCSTFGYCSGQPQISCSSTEPCAQGACSNDPTRTCTPRARIQYAIGAGTASQIDVTLNKLPFNGNALIAVVGARGGGVQSISQTGASWSKATESVQAGGLILELWYALDVRGAGQTVRITRDSVYGTVAVVVEYSGPLMSLALDKVAPPASGVGTALQVGPTANTAQTGELWIAAFASAGDPSFTSYNALGFSPASPVAHNTEGDDATDIVAIALENRSNVAGPATATVGLNSEHEWSGVLATFKMVGNTCPGGSCRQQFCDRDFCSLEDTIYATSRWCEKSPDQECAVDTDCAPQWAQGVCNRSKSACNPASPGCPAGEVCVAGDRCVGASNTVAGTGGGGAYLRQDLWTVNDETDTRGRAGIKLHMTGGDIRIYRSSSPDGPYCALVWTGSRTYPLPAGISECVSEVPGRQVYDDVYSTDYTIHGGGRLWDRTVKPEQVYYYRVSYPIITNGQMSEEPIGSLPMVSARQLGYDPDILPPVQGFQARAPKEGSLTDQQGVLLRWCKLPAAADLPSVKEYRVYRRPYLGQDALLARIDPACLASGARCQINPSTSCLGGGSCQPITPIQGFACSSVAAPQCGVLDATFRGWPSGLTPIFDQTFHNYTYYVTTVALTASGAETESAHSQENQGWLNYCDSSVCSERRDPDGDGAYLVCGDEDARLGVPQDFSPATQAPYRVIGQTNPANPPARFVFYHLDHLGSPRLILDSDGHLVAQHNYLPFGEERPSTTPATLNTRHFTGHERDDESGLDYMLARYYSSSLGRFMAVDPGPSVSASNPQTWNRYAYVLNNPLNLTDPNGQCSAPAGGNGVCVEGFIAAPRITVLGIGDNRSHSATDPTLTSRVQVQVSVNGGGTLDVQTTAGFSEVLISGSGWGEQGVAMTTVSNEATMADGSVSFTANITGMNGMAGYPFAPDEAIDMSLNMTVAPTGQASIQPGSVADGYPSIGIYDYSNGEPQTLYEGGEGSPSDLAPPMERSIPATQQNKDR